jgi:exosortase
MKKITIALALLLSVLYYRSFIWLANAWLTDPYYSHGFLVLVVSAFIAWINIREHKKEDEFKSEPFKPGIFIFAFGLLLYIVGFIKVFPFLAALSFLFTLSGLILYFYGKPLMHSLLFPVSFFIFAIPLPLLILEKLTFVLQSLSARYSVSIIELLGIPVERIGAEIHLQNAAFTIGLPCSGMNTLISLLAMAAILIYILRCGMHKKAVLFCAAVPIALGANIFRIVSILLVANAYGAEAAMKFFHNFSSILLFLVAFFCLLIVSKTFGCKLFFPKEKFIKEK